MLTAAIGAMVESSALRKNNGDNTNPSREPEEHQHMRDIER